MPYALFHVKDDGSAFLRGYTGAHFVKAGWRREWEEKEKEKEKNKKSMASMSMSMSAIQTAPAHTTTPDDQSSGWS